MRLRRSGRGQAPASARNCAAGWRPAALPHSPRTAPPHPPRSRRTPPDELPCAVTAQYPSLTVDRHRQQTVTTPAPHRTTADRPISGRLDLDRAAARPPRRRSRNRALAIVGRINTPAVRGTSTDNTIPQVSYRACLPKRRPGRCVRTSPPFWGCVLHLLATSLLISHLLATDLVVSLIRPISEGRELTNDFCGLPVYR